MMTSLLAISFLLSALIAGLNAEYCMPRDDCWPDDTDIELFASGLGGEVMLPSHVDYKETIRMKDLVYTKSPGIIIFVLSAQDIKKCLQFAKQYHIRVTIISAGHSFTGRSTADGSLQINVSRMTKRHLNLGDSRSDTGNSVTVETGNTWKDVYQEVDSRGFVVVVGSAHTVSVAGYTLGGGHSTISPTLGLGADNVVAFQMVLASGNIVNVTKDRIDFIDDTNTVTDTKIDSDLFWSVVGGGGGTFGVVTSLIVKLHPAPSQIVGFNCFYSVPYRWDEPSDAAPLIEVTNFFFNTIKTLPPQWGGYHLISISLVNEDPIELVVNTMILLTHYGEWGLPSRAAVDPFLQLKPELQSSCGYTNFSSLWEQKKDYTDPIYTRVSLDSFFLADDDFSEDMAEALYGALLPPGGQNAGGACTMMMLGGEVTNAAGRNSISQRFREARLLPVCSLGWQNPEDDEANQRAVRDFNEAIWEKFPNLPRGKYFNEANFYQDNWQEDFFGDHYDRLLATKKDWDPDNTFYCRSCVGSELVPDPDIRSGAVSIVICIKMVVVLIAGCSAFCAIIY